MDTASLLLKHGANKEHRDNDGRTPLSLASMGPLSWAVESLLQEGANKEHQDKDGMTPLSLASMNGQGFEVMLLLRSYDAPFEDRIAELLSPRYIQRKYSRKECQYSKYIKQKDNLYCSILQS